MKMPTKPILKFLLPVLFFTGLYANTAFACASNDPSSPVGIVPVLVAGNPALCTGGVRIDPPVSGTYNLGSNGQITITITNGPCGQVFSWSVSGNVIVDQIVAKGGNDANVYDYTGQNPATTSDGNLHSPVNASGNYAALSHIDICFSYKLTVSKTAVGKFTRTYDWDIEKSCDGPDPLILSPGQIYDYPFSWTLTSSYTDSDFKAEGIITIANNTPFSATITSVTDVVTPGNFAGTVNCGVSFPYVLPAGQSLGCPYTVTLPDATSRLNTATVTTSTPNVKGGTATAAVNFSGPTQQINECVSIWDDCTPSGPQTVVCYTGTTYNYTCPVGPYEECGDYEHTNSVYARGSDSNTILDSDYCIVDVEVPCEGGCTLTPGYWKTHSEFGPAPYDNTWAQLPNGASTAFFLSGKTYYQALWTPPAGNVYYILARAYIATLLNQLNGASIPAAVLTAFNSATAIFNTYTPAQVGAWKGAARNNVVNLATILDNYNNGITGPGHCSEESSNGSSAGRTIASYLDDLGEDIQLTVQPNPFDEQAIFVFSVPYSSKARLEMYDASGRLVSILFDGYLEADQPAQAVFTTDASSTGMFIYRLTTDREVKSGQLMPVR